MKQLLTRDYPVIFATLYFFSLLGLIMGILGEFMYSIIDPRIDFETREYGEKFLLLIEENK
jgi:ABC-type uncharacterized transport system, permease component